MKTLYANPHGSCKREYIYNVYTDNITGLYFYSVWFMHPFACLLPEP